MVQFFDNISDDHAEWIRKQRIFFVGTAPLDGRGTVNNSPKGYDCLRVLNSNQVCYLEMSGSGIETQSHLEENGRITIMLTAFEGGPRIMRLMGTGRVIRVDTPEFNTLMETYYEGSELARASGKRAIILADVRKVSTSCGYGVPYFDYKGARNTLIDTWSKRDEDKVKEYWKTINKFSLDGLPGMRHELLGPEFVGRNRGAGEEIVLPGEESWGALLRGWVKTGPAPANAAYLVAGAVIGGAISHLYSRRR
ncbi:hypothetical protein K457DRAFT_28106 [Linnemannia elongata AG-77]|uniref:Pyridoxamine 5'-phosphate oxidase N-terminal domain-containing protein n=1 Tax=Linnemannia elongata AG-77 TaxID=1314771 RepID=A0A197KDG2_9FUNG|nr:hypothetical protein K457DRAFT_28106 [Linnemannia elongata AG-77]